LRPSSRTDKLCQSEVADKKALSIVGDACSPSIVASSVLVNH
jgi:hypothetical protein